MIYPLGGPRAMMARRMEPADLAQERLRRQRLVGPPFARPADAVAALTCVQAQDRAGALWAVGQRTRGATAADLERALDRGELVRTHVLRPTWHLVHPADLRWLLALTGPRVRAANASMDRKLTLDERVFRRSNEAIARALEGGEALTRAELGEVVRAAGIKKTGNSLAHLVMRAELDAILCSGPRRGAQTTYVAFDRRVPPARPRPREAMLAELATRYLAGHGPATARDLAWWSGLTLGDARAAIALAGATTFEVGGLPYHRVGRRPSGARGPRLHLLPNYDELLIAYRDREVSVAPARLVGARPMLFANHLVILDGQLIGGWRRTLARDAVDLEVSLLDPLDAAGRAALDEAAARYGRFLELPVRLRVARGRR